MYFSSLSDLFILVEVVVCNSQEFVRTQLLVIFVTWIYGLIIKIFFFPLWSFPSTSRVLKRDFTYWGKR